MINKKQYNNKYEYAVLTNIYNKKLTIQQQTAYNHIFDPYNKTAFEQCINITLI